MPFASTHGSKVEYFETGTGPGLVLVHGTGGDAGTYDQLRDTFSDRRTVVVPNYSGSGATEDEGGPLTLDLLIAQIDAAIEDSSAQGPVDLVGWSQGALAVAAYAAVHPEKVRRLVLLTGWIKNDARQQLYFDLWHRLDQLDHETFGRFLQLNGWTTTQVNSFGVAGVEEMVSGGIPAGIGRQIALNLELDITEHLPKITAPTLVIGATHDNMIPVQHSRALHEAIKGSRYAELDAGHFAVFEKPAELAELIGEFLAEEEAEDEAKAGTEAA
ncbi:MULTISPECIES: alpha/beta hydrolase [Streptomyces]|uniref:Alpha/beta hydrolase n=1 Tax=Streptomyces venezuelae TaxID=54571 RepID=A0A5P2BG64_STRVZ|nr:MULTISPECIES: alpha/beta hydrolase [Streptomyces]NDZ98645.1 alpha/beta hydrolase [Streptomyces sp. SID10116]MYY83218.1 alpha/beta fold hydrolase [Streptomyces sp. SID335]MYZ16622.1 alpha/beta fold hydrolase [Streptomyces sp. SID337]NDZ88522.1 alpha/beta hydrolase [Streptomyces sp. SID10115]NEB44199.1 alpha/beta hydrolase [Streptomyces sp. SID339]